MSDAKYMLDTNIASYVIKGNSEYIRKRFSSLPMSAIYVSVITEAELLRGVARKPEAKKLALIVREFLLRVNILDFDGKAARAYAEFRTRCDKAGKALGAMDMLIASHSLATDSILVTNDQAFYQMKHILKLQDGTQ